MKLNTLVAGVTIATLFSTGFLWKLPEIDFFLYYVLVPPLLMLGFVLSAGAVSVELLLFLAVLLVHALWSGALSGNPIGGALQQLAGFGAMLMTVHYAFRINGFDAEKLFGIYIRIAVAVCGIGLFQLLCFGLDLRPGYDFGWLLPGYNLQLNQLGILRVQSVMLEPAHFGIVTAPAVFVAVQNLTARTAHFMSRRQSAVVLLAAAASFSAVAYTAVLVALALAALNRGLLSRLLAAGAGGGLLLLAYAYVPDIRLRVDDMVALLLHESVLTANWSSLTVYNNALVAWQSLLGSNLLGGGLGSHPLSFLKYSILYGISDVPLRYALLNNADASSLLLRIASELGLPGLIAAAAFLFRFYVRRTPAGARRERALFGAERREWLISNAALVFFAVALMRQGHYFNYGLPFFGLLYLEAGRAHRAATAALRGSALEGRPA